MQYDDDEVDHLLDEKDAEIEDLLRQNRELCQALQVMYSKEEYGKLQTEIEMLKAKLENVQESAYAESVDAGMREHRLQRALWFARALRARDIQRYWIAATCAPITERACRVWNNVEIKCFKKAEEYK